MKKLFTLLFCSFIFLAKSQAPQQISYQGIARSATGQVVASQPIGVKFDLHQGSASGSIVFSEAHGTSTNPFGLFTLAIGSANPSSFTAINWASGPYFLEVSIDPAGGTSYVSVGNQQLMSVPYALYAEKSGNSTQNPTLSVNSNSLSISNGNTVILPTGTTYTAGTGIDLTGNVVTNTAPNQTVNVTGSNVTGSYPNYTINSTPTQTLSISGNTIDISNGNSIVLPTGTTYTAGLGIDLTGNIVTNTNPDQVVSLFGIGGATVTGAYPNYTVNVPNGTSLPSAYNGQIMFYNGTVWDTIPQLGLFYDKINNRVGVGTDTPVSDFHVNGAGRFDASVSTPQIYTNAIQIAVGTFTNVGDVLTNDGAGNGTWQTPATYSLSQGGTNINLLKDGLTVATVTLAPGTSYVAGTGIAVSGGTISNTAPNQTVNISGTAVTGAYPNYTINAPATTSLTQGTNVTLNQSGNNYTVNGVTPTLSVIGGTLSGTYPSQTLSIPASTLTTIMGSANVLVSGTAPNYTLSSPSQSLSVAGNSLSISGANTVTIPTSTVVAGNSNVTVTPSGNTYSVSAVTPTLSVVGGTLTGTYPTQTITIPTGSLTTITGSTNVTVIGSPSSYTLSSPSQSLSVSGNSLSITGANTVTIPTSTVVAGNSNITVTPSGNTYSVSAITPTLSVIGGSIAGAYPTQTLTIPAMAVNGIGTGIATVTTSVNNFTVNVPSPTFAPATGVLSFGTSTLNTSPTLSLSGTTLSSGAITNSVNLATLPSNWTVASGVIYPSTLTNSVGVGTSGPLTDKMEISYSSSPTSTHIHLRQGGADAFSRIKFSNSVAPAKYWINSVTSAATDNNSGYNIFYYNGSVGRNLFTVAGDGKVSVNPFSLSYPTLFEVNGGVELDSTINFNGLNAMPPASVGGAGKIYFDRASSRFKVSENGGAYVNLIGGASPWIQGAGIITQNNIGDLVGIGTATPTSQLHIYGMSDPLQVTVENAGGNFKTGYRIKTALGEWFMGQDGPASTGFSITDRLASAVRLQIDPMGNVGIGTTTPGSKLDVADTYSISGGTVINVSGTSSSSSGANSAIYTNIDGSSAGNYISGYFRSAGLAGSTGSLFGVKGLAVGASTSNANAVGVDGNGQGASQNYGVSAIANTAIGLTNYGIYAEASSVGSNYAVYAVANGTTGTSYAAYLKGHTYNEGKFALGAITGTPTALANQGTMYYDNTLGKIMVSENAQPYRPLFTSAPWIQATGSVTLANIGDKVGIGTSTPQNKLHIIETATIAAINVNNSGSGEAINAIGGTGRAIYASSNAGGMSTIETTNNSSGYALNALKSYSLGGVVSISNSSASNGSEPLYVSNVGSGATIRAVAGTTTLSALSLYLDNGHFKSTQATSLTASTVSTSISFSGASYSFTNATDVKGMLQAVMTTTSTTSIYANSVITIRVNFAKPYTVAPIVVVTPVQDMVGLSYYVSNITSTYFYITIRNSTAATITVPSLTMSFNYMVIE